MIQLLVPAGAVALLALPLIVLLYFLKARRPEVRVASLLLWARHVADRQANAPWQRLRWSVLLVAQLLVAALLAAAVMRPGLPGAAGVGSTTVVLLDASASMRASDVAPTRFAAAVERARGLAGGLGSGRQLAIVLMAEHAQLLAAPTSDTAQLNAALDRAAPSTGTSNLGEGLSLADALLAGRPAGSIVLIGDGHSRPPVVPARVHAAVTYLSVGVSGENLAVEALSRTPGGTVFARIANYGREPRSGRLQMLVDGRLADVLPFRVDGNASADLSWTGLPGGAQALEARLDPPDALRLDDSAWLLTATPPARTVLLVTSDNGFLERALGLRPGVTVRTVKPSDYRPDTPADLFVFDGFVPPGKLPQPALVVGPPPGQGPVPAGPPVNPGGVLPGSPAEPLLRDVNLRDVHVQVAARVAVPPGWRALVSAVDDPLVLVRDGEPRTVELTFDIHHSDLPLRASFPILVQNLLGYLLPGGFENQSYPLGAAVDLAAEPGATRIEVTTPGGRVDRLTAPPARFTDTTSPGIYTVRQEVPGGARSSRFAVQFRDPSLSRIAPGAAAIPFEEERPAVQPVPRGVLEVWPWLAGAALVLVVAEWLVYLRAADTLLRTRRWRRG